MSAVQSSIAVDAFGHGIDDGWPNVGGDQQVE
jgi:hypothetical protein